MSYFVQVKTVKSLRFKNMSGVFLLELNIEIFYMSSISKRKKRIGNENKNVWKKVCYYSTVLTWKKKSSRNNF